MGGADLMHVLMRRVLDILVFGSQLVNVCWFGTRAGVKWRAAAWDE